MSAEARRRGQGDRRRARPLGRRGSYQASKAELLTRFRRLNGQLLGIAQMIEAERYCPDVLVQLSSVIAALEKVGFILLRDHVQHCVADGIARGEGDAYMDELMATVERFSRR